MENDGVKTQKAGGQYILFSVTSVTKRTIVTTMSLNFITFFLFAVYGTCFFYCSIPHTINLKLKFQSQKLNCVSPKAFI